MRGTLLLLFLLLQTFSLSLRAQDISVSTASYKQMVVGLTSFDEANTNQVTERISTIDGIQLTAYCPELNCLIIDFDPLKFIGPDNVMQALHTMKISGFLKYNTTLDPLTTGCTVMSQNIANSEH